MDKKDVEEVTQYREKIFKGNIIEVVVDHVELPGKKGQATRELVLHPGAVGIIPFLSDGRVLFVQQYRKALDRIILEIPAGKIELGETDTKLVAKRELEEETEYQAGSMTHWQTFVTSPGFANETLHMYIAEDLVKVKNPLPPDEDEFIEVVPLTLVEAKEAIVSGFIYDAKTIMAVQYWELRQYTIK